MILADTSVWIDYFRSGHTELQRLLEDGEVAMHPMVLGELACGNLVQRSATLHLLNAIPKCEIAPHAVVLQAVEARRWFGSGIGWIDAHLLTASLLLGMPLVTSDTRLARLAQATRVT
jgi:predicted nucleic acid-binding protein